MIFNRLTAEQVTSVHKLFHFLRKIRVIGLVVTKTDKQYLTDYGKPDRYNLVYCGYDETMKNKLTPEEAMEMLTIFSEELGLYDDTSSEPLGSCRPHDSDQ